MVGIPEKAKGPDFGYYPKPFKEQYTKNKVEGCVKDLQSLSKYAQDDPQATYSAYTKGLCSRWTHFQRTVLDNEI